VRPRSIVIACADGAGTGHQNDCTPYCAARHFHAYPLAVRLDRVARCGSRKELQFIRLTWTFPARGRRVSREVAPRPSAAPERTEGSIRLTGGVSLRP